jgi:hypothetical protein
MKSDLKDSSHIKINHVLYTQKRNIPHHFCVPRWLNYQTAIPQHTQCCFLDFCILGTCDQTENVHQCNLTQLSFKCTTKYNSIKSKLTTKFLQAEYILPQVLLILQDRRVLWTTGCQVNHKSTWFHMVSQCLYFEALQFVLKFITFEFLTNKTMWWHCILFFTWVMCF